MDKETSGAKAGGGLCQWTPTQSTFVLTFLSNIVADGTKTSTGFKKVHLNACAKVLIKIINERFSDHTDLCAVIYRERTIPL